MNHLGPQCIECNAFATLSDTGQVFPDRGRSGTPIWLCRCGAYVGCHKGTREPLGRPAGPDLRRARQMLHRRLDPIWRDAYAGTRDERSRVGLTRLARRRLYAYLAAQTGLSEADCHTAMFDLDQCRRAWLVLRGLTYDDVRVWAHQQPPSRLLGNRPKAGADAAG